jgi:hypothetical protein
MGRQVWKSCSSYVGLVSPTNVVEPHILPCFDTPWLCPLFQIQTWLNFHIHFFQCASHLMYVESRVSASSRPIWLWLREKIDIIIFLALRMMHRTTWHLIPTHDIDGGKLLYKLQTMDDVHV